MNNEEILKENDGKKFDICLMNPPFNRSLHLQFLEKTIKIADNVISVQPCWWLMDIPAVIGWKKTTYQKFEHNVSKHIKELDIISAHDANKIFGIVSFERIGIYECDHNEYETYKTIYEYDKRKSKSIFDKVIRLVHDKKCQNILDNIRISSIHGHPGQKDEFDVITPQYKLIKKLKPETMSEEDFINWHNSCNTKFMKYCNLLTRRAQSLNPNLLPFMDDYSKPWDDNRFYKYFKLNKEEIDLIESSMDKYMYKINNGKF